ncbi:hypothetical protein Mapa_000189 [Marchantia paleacea]|nr:hypothetical protein Mapa_000189 [Marchantia paleacea]
MALVQVKQVFRVGLVQKVTRYVSPPQPSSSTSFLWKSDSMSRQRRNVILAQVAECRSTFFTTSTAEVGGGSAQGADPTPEESSTTGLDSTSADSGSSSGGAESDILDRTYGQQQEDHHKVANHSHEHFMQKEDEEEGLESTGFDISKVSKPSGDE